MSTEARQGTPQFPQMNGDFMSSTHTAIDSAIQTLQQHKNEWVKISVSQRITLLEQLLKKFMAITSRWVAASLQAKGINPALEGEEWMAGTWPVVRNVRLLRQSLVDIETYGRPRIPGPIATRPNGQVAARVFPQSAYDSVFFTGVTAEIWMEPGVQEETLPQTQARIYQGIEHDGRVALVLGAGNVASIGPMDILYKLFVEDMVVLYKANPVNAYLSPLIEEAFQPLLKAGYLRVVYGGVGEGAYMCSHPGIDEIHITGSDKTFDAIVFGSGPEGAERKANNRPVLNKRITGELGNVSPVIIVPGHWSKSDLAYQAEHLASMLVNNAGFNCNATRIIITHNQWEQREELLEMVRGVLARVPTRKAYYPGAQQRFQRFLDVHPNAERFGTAGDGELPWTLIAGVDPQQKDDICFTTEAFCGLFAETALDAASPQDYIGQAVHFCNEQLWGSLNATILIHPQSLKAPGVEGAFERALSDLRYGTIGINYWAAAAFTIGVTPWGAFPGHPINDIQSGTGMVHNTFMFEQPQKTILRAPFRSQPTPPWFALRSKTATSTFPKLTAFEARPSL
ncbi:MAG: aldehyde dehydrogenase family protein, partial [Ktedonobacteraceae bacterium]|nr:aldehyde dehydrogenase family protein [Ktedonobacteraceae bacterium]